MRNASNLVVLFFFGWRRFGCHGMGCGASRASPKDRYLDHSVQEPEQLSPSALKNRQSSQSNRSVAGESGWSAFISHYKVEAATEARWLQEHLEPHLNRCPVFLDSDGAYTSFLCSFRSPHELFPNSRGIGCMAELFVCMIANRSPGSEHAEEACARQPVPCSRPDQERIEPSVVPGRAVWMRILQSLTQPPNLTTICSLEPHVSS